MLKIARPLLVVILVAAAEMFSGTGLALAGSCAGLAAPQASAQVQREAGRKTYDIDIYYPKNSDCENRPALIFFHGGGWSGGGKRQFRRQAKIMTRDADVVVLSANYPLTSNPAEATEYASAAVCWLKANSAKFGIDPQRIAVSGGSAGGQIATAMVLTEDKALAPECSGVQRPYAGALILFNPVFEFTPERQRKLKGDLTSVEPMAILNSALPPTLILQGSADVVTPLATAQKFAAKAREIGSRNVKLVEFKGRGHGFFNSKKDNDINRAVEETLNFLKALGWIAGSAGTKAN